MAHPKVIIMAMDKAMKKHKDGSLPEKEQKRLLKILKSELGTESSKLGEGDPIELKIFGTVKTKGNDDFDIEVDNTSIFENEKKGRVIVPPIISPSA